MADRQGNQGRFLPFFKTVPLESGKAPREAAHAMTDAMDIPEIEALFAQAPWNLGENRAEERQIDVPSMLAPEELRLYHWAARHWARGDGDLVDLGTFAGGSTARLAHGVAGRGGQSRVHAYDRFTADEGTKKKTLYARGVPEFEGNDLLPLAQEFLAPWAPNVVFHQGQIQDLGWSGGPIEVLALDAGKNAHTLDQIVRPFYPSLIPGRSILLQQDFLHFAQPWLVSQMVRMSECFRPVGFARNHTLVFLCTAPVTDAVLKAGAVANLTDEEMLSDIATMQERVSDWGMDNHFEYIAACLEASPGARISWKMKKLSPHRFF